MSTSDLVFVEEVEARIATFEPLAVLSPSEQREKRLCAIVRALLDEHTKNAERVKRYGDAYLYWLSRSAENDAKFVDARNKLADETAQREAAEASRDHWKSSWCHTASQLEDAISTNAKYGTANTALLLENEILDATNSKLRLDMNNVMAVFKREFDRADAAEAELALRRKRRFVGRHEEETGVRCGDYDQHCETGWACNACGVFSGNEHDPCENCDNEFIRLENETAALRERIAKLESEGAALFASEQAAVRLATEASALAVSSGERLAKLESLGLWIEANRVAELDRAKTWAGCARDEAYVLGREDAFKQVGYELNNRAGKDLRKEPTNEPMG